MNREEVDIVIILLIDLVEILALTTFETSPTKILILGFMNRPMCFL